eukprot:COSAG01_NODE_8490_length_2767_cov_3.606071_1_plen_388_part_10
MPLCASLLVGLLFLMHACMHVLRVRYTRMCRCAAALLSARARLVDACLGVQHAALLIESRPYTQRERAVWLANHLLRRMLDRHTHVVLHAMQDFLARLMRTTAPVEVAGAGGDTVGRRLAAEILDTGPDTLGGADHGLQLELLRCLQLLCEGLHVPGQQALAETGLIKACCDLVKQCHLPQLVMATIHQTGQQQKQEHDRRTGCIMKILVTEQALLTVVEAIQGPNITARQAVLEQSLDDVLCELLVTLGIDRHRALGQLESEEQEEGETRKRQDPFPPPVTAKSGRKLSVEPPATTASHDKPGGGWRCWSAVVPRPAPAQHDDQQYSSEGDVQWAHGSACGWCWLDKKPARGRRRWRRRPTGGRVPGAAARGGQAVLSAAGGAAGNR